MTIRALVLDPSKPAGALIEIDPTGEVLRGLIGGWLEVVALGEGAVGYVNEDGKRLGLPRNDLATRLTLAANTGLHPDDFISGVMVVVGDGGPLDPDDRDVPDALLDLCRRHSIPVEA